MPQHRRLFSLLVALSLGSDAFASCLSAQSSSDTLAVVKAIAEGVVHEARHGGDHHGPFALSDSGASFWGPAVVALLRSEHPDLLVSTTPHTLRMAVGEVTIFGDSAHATVIWLRCTEGVGRLNFWEHRVLYLLQRSGSAWHFIGRQIVEFADGRC